MNMDLQFSGNDPGAVTLGNFINYYEFHPPEERLKLLPDYLWEVKGNKYTCLDVGCNTGVLTIGVFESISKSLEAREASTSGLKNLCTILGVDIDPVLIQRAQEMNKYTDQVKFVCLDIMSAGKDLMCQQYLSSSDNQFDVVFCFSVSMWIHLNHGDIGLKQFLTDISTMGKLLVIEPQPWKCYKSAVKRLKKCNKSFPHFDSIKIRENVAKYIEDFVINSCLMEKVYESAESKWGRKLLCFKKKDRRCN